MYKKSGFFSHFRNYQKYTYYIYDTYYIVTILKVFAQFTFNFMQTCYYSVHFTFFDYHSFLCNLYLLCVFSGRLQKIRLSVLTLDSVIQTEMFINVILIKSAKPDTYWLWNRELLKQACRPRGCQDAYQEGQIMPTTLLLAPRIFRPSYGPCYGSELYQINYRCSSDVLKLI